MAMLLHAPADDLAVQYVQGGKQRGRAVPDVVVCHGAAAALLHRQTRLSAIERLYLALFIDRENDSVRRRVHIEPDDVSQLGGKLRVVGQLEQARPVRPQTMSAPDALHRTDLIPWSLAMAGAVQCVVSPGGSIWVAATTRAATSASSGGMRDGRVLSRSRPATPSVMKRSCQRQTTVLLTPACRMISAVPQPSAVNNTI